MTITTEQETEETIGGMDAEGDADPPKKGPSPETIARRKRGLVATRAFGAELRRRRINKGYKFMRALVEEMGDTSEPYMSQVERGYRSDDGRPVFMSDDKMLRLSRVLDWPLVEMYGILGRLPEDNENIFSLDRRRVLDDWKKLSPRDQFLLLRELASALDPESGDDVDK